MERKQLDRVAAQVNNAAQMISSALKADFYVYEITLEGVANGASATGQLNVQANSDFVIQQLAATVTNASTNALIASPSVLTQLTDTGSGVGLFTNQLQLTSVFGTALQPFILPLPRVIESNSTLTADVVNNTGVTADIQLCFIGVRTFEAS